MKKQKIEVQGIKVRIEEINNEDYVSLTDIAKQSDKRAAVLIISWLKNNSTILFLETWETIHNPDFKVHQMVNFKISTMDNGKVITPQKYIEATNAIGLISKSGRYGGTYAHKDIALNFCYWLNPVFQVYMLKTFQDLVKAEYQRNNLEWHISKITDNIDEVRNLLDTIPYQKPSNNRLDQNKNKT